MMLSTKHLHFGPVCSLIGFGCNVKLPYGVDRGGAQLEIMVPPERWCPPSQTPLFTITISLLLFP